MAALPPRIDVHSHFLPPFYSTLLASTGHSKPDGMPRIPPWSLPAHLEMMSAANVRKSILSISSPGTNLLPNNSDLALKTTRECNAYAANLKASSPEKFGFWAALPLPDVAASLLEIDTAVKEGADGFGLMTNYHGSYIGSPAFNPVFEKLNRLGATVFIHPTTPCMQYEGKVVQAKPLGELLPAPTLEFFFDTARAVVDLFVSGTVERCPDVVFVIPHVGGALMPVLTRFVTLSTLIPGQTPLNATTVHHQLSTQFYFDLAGTPFDGPHGPQGQLKAFVDGFSLSHERLLYGSDFPFTGTAFVEEFAQRMKEGMEELFDEGQRERVYMGNAEALLAKKMVLREG